MPPDGPSVALGAGGRAFRRLGLGVVRHPWYAIGFWIVLLALSLPLLMHLGGATQNSAATVPASAPSSVAAAQIARLFPNQSAPTSTLLLFTGANITGPGGQKVVLAAAAAVRSDPKLRDLGGVSSLYSEYATYLQGAGELALGVLGPASTGPAAILPPTAATAQLLWAPPALYFSDWSALVAGHPGTAPTDWNYAAFSAANSTLSTPGGRLVLDAFYAGVPGGPAGFNASAPGAGLGACALSPGTAAPCAEATARATGVLVVAAAANAQNTTPPPDALVSGVLGGLGFANFSDPTALRGAAVLALAVSSGLSARWLGTVWSEFPNGSASALALSAWTGAIAEGPVSAYPLPIPAALGSAFVAPDGSATLVIVTFTVSDSFTTAAGDAPVLDDVAEIDRAVLPAMRAADPSGTVHYVQTGPAALDADENHVLAQNLAIVLPLTLAILVVITVLYFRAPLTPAITFGGLGIALGLGLAGLVGISALFGKVDPTAITLENTFVLGVGTDYSIFLVARYREELRKGAPPDEAVVTTVTWAGQSIATSGGTAILATLALAFSGVGLLSQWGETLSLAVLIMLLVALTLVPSFLVLIGPRTFWPEVGDRARRKAQAEESAQREGRGYFFRAGRIAQRRPKAVLGIVLLASIPLLYVAVSAPLGYDFYQQLPTQPGATQGLADLSKSFGPGTAFPTQVLLTFQQPLFRSGAPNVTEFADLGSITQLLNSTPGVAVVRSPVGPMGASLPEWLAYAGAPVGAQQGLLATLAPYLGNDGRTVLLLVVPSYSGLSTEAVQLLQSIRSSIASFAAAHPEVAGVQYGGGAAVTSDLSAQTALATQRMILAVSIGLLIVLFVVLRSALIPPMAVATIGLSIGWAWGATQLVFTKLLGLPLFFFVPTVLFILILGLGIDYNIFLLTRIREERLRGRTTREAVLQGVARTGGIITAAAIILAGAFAALTVGDFVLLKAIGFSVAAAVLLDAMVVRTYLVPASLTLLGDRVWSLFPGRVRPPREAPDRVEGPSGPDGGVAE